MFGAILREVVEQSTKRERHEEKLGDQARVGMLKRPVAVSEIGLQDGPAGAFEQKVTVSGLPIMMSFSLVHCSALHLR